MQNLNCTSSDIACARNKTTDQVTAAQINASSTFLKQPENQWVLPAAVFRPTVDKSLIPADFADLLNSGKYNKKANVLWGFTKDEGNLFVSGILPDPVPVEDIDKEFDKLVPYNRTRVLIESPYYKKDNSTDSVRKAFGEGISDYYWVCPYLIFSRAGAIQNSNFYTYQMDHGRTASILGIPPTPLCQGYVCHGDDLIPSFGSGDVIPGVEQTGDDARFARQVIDRFTTFAKTGNPNPPKNSPNFGAAAQNPDLTRVQWPKYDQSNPVYSFALANSNVTKNSHAGRCEWLSENTQFDYQVNGPGGEFVPIYPPIPKPPTSSTKTGSGTTLIQTPSSVSGRPTTTNTLTTQAPITTVTTPSPTDSEYVSTTSSGSASLTIIPVVPTTTTTDGVTVPPTTSAPSPLPTDTTTMTTTAAPVETTAVITTTSIGPVETTVSPTASTVTDTANPEIGTTTTMVSASETLTVTSVIG